MSRLLAGVIVLGCCSPDEAHAEQGRLEERKTVKITEWVVPWQKSHPRDPYVDDRNRVWFVSQGGDYLGYLDPFSGKFSRFPLQPGTRPHSLLVDQDVVWYAGNGASHIGKLLLERGVLVKHPMPESDARDPHTLVFDARGDIWFTVQHGNFVGRLEPKSGDIRLIPIPTPGARPYGIVVDSDDRPWIAEYGSNKLAVVDPKTMQIREYRLPRESARPRRLAVTSDGAVWYVDYAKGYLGRLEPATATVREWAVPGGRDARPYGMAADHRDRIWFVETGRDPNRFVGFDPTAETFFSITGIGSGGGAIRRMHFHSPSRTVWFGTDANTIGRADVR